MWFVGLLLRCMTAESLLPFKKRCLLKLHSVEPPLLADTRRRVTTAAQSLTSSAYPLSRPGYRILPGWPMEKYRSWGKFLYPVHQMSSAFKSKFLDSLKRALREQNQLMLFNDQIQRAYSTPWVVNCQPSMASAEHVVRYLGQYTHRVAITNQRIVNITDEKVTFIARDYRQGAAKKYITLGGVEFLRRFAQHILPRRFVKIRRYGIYNHTAKRNLGIKFRVEDESEGNNKSKSRKTIESNIERFERLTGINPCHCPVCKTGQMIRIRRLPPIRSPPGTTFIQTHPQL